MVIVAMCTFVLVSLFFKLSIILFSYALVLKRLGLLNEALPYFVRTVKAVPHLWSAWEDLVMLIDSEQKVE
jgi:hypothetical protein